MSRCINNLPMHHSFQPQSPPLQPPPLSTFDYFFSSSLPRLPSLPEASTRLEESRLIQDEQKKALEKLKREIYNPTPKGISRGLNLYYREENRQGFLEKEKQRGDDGKSCAICLDDFKPREEVTLTPCDHMYHENCIVPWVKNQGQCPVCRSALCE